MAFLGTDSISTESEDGRNIQPQKRLTSGVFHLSFESVQVGCADIQEHHPEPKRSLTCKYA